MTLTVSREALNFARSLTHSWWERNSRSTHA